MRCQRVLFVIGLLAMAAGPAHAGDPGLAGVPFLRIGFGARASAMGEAYVAVAEDATSIYWNPGAMAAVLGTNLGLAHTEYFGSMRLEQAAVTHETSWGTIGFRYCRRPRFVSCGESGGAQVGGGGVQRRAAHEIRY